MKMSISYICVILFCGTCLAVEQKVFNFTDGNYTFLERMDLSMNITYLLKNNSSATVTKKFPQTATLVKDLSNVTETNASLVLIWGEMNANNFTQNFTSDKEKFSMTSMGLWITFDKETFPDAKNKDAHIQFTTKEFESPLNTSYSCNALIEVNSTETPGANATLTFSNMQLQPFSVNVTTKNFSKAKSCSADMPSTTPAPMTTTSPPPMTTTSPPPKVFANHLNFTSHGESCILETMNATFQVDVDKKTIYFLMTEATVITEASHCGDKTKKTAAILAAKWTGEDDKVNNITQLFVIEKGSYYLKNVTLFLNGAKTLYHYNFTLPSKDNLMMTNFESSLKCDTNQTAQFNSTEEMGNVTMYLSEVRFQAFDIKKSNFSKAENCPADNPIPVPEPQWNNTLIVTYPKNKTACIKELTNATFVVHDKKMTTVFNMTGATVIEGSSVCGNRTNKTAAVVAAKWGDNTITQTFAIKDDHYFLQNVTLYLKKDKLVYNYSFTLDDETLFYTPFGDSLLCNSNQTKTIHNKDLVNITMTFSDVQFQAFDIDAKSGNFSKEYVCSADNSMGNIVPIAVGAALAVLVIIVLIAYLIGRRNSSRAGYESV